MSKYCNLCQAFKHQLYIMIKPKHVYNNYHQDNLYLLEVMPDLSLYSI